MLQGFGHVQHHTSYGHGHIWGWHVRQISIWWLHICALIEQARSWHCSKNITAARCNFPGILRIWSWFYRDWLYIAGYQMLPYKKHIYICTYFRQITFINSSQFFHHWFYIPTEQTTNHDKPNKGASPSGASRPLPN